MDRRTITVSPGRYETTIKDDGLVVTGESGDPLLAIRAAEAALENARMARRASPASKVDIVSGLILETE